MGSSHMEVKVPEILGNDVSFPCMTVKKFPLKVTYSNAYSEICPDFVNSDPGLWLAHWATART
jgi:hypothetical protein